MLSNRNMRRLLWGVVWATTAALVLMAGNFREPSDASVRFDTVTVSHDGAGRTRLLVAGRGVHDGLQALLIPDQQTVDIATSAPDVPGTLPHCDTDGRLAVVTTNDLRLLTIDATPGRRVEVLGGLPLFPQRNATYSFVINGLTLVGSKALVAVKNVGLILVDVAEPAAPKEVDRVEFPEHFTDLTSAGGTVYAISANAGLVAATVEGDRLRCRQVPGSVGAWRLAVSGRHLVTGGLKGLLTLYELDPRGDVRPVGQVQLPQGIRDLDIVRETLYLGMADGQLLGYSLSSWPRLGPVGRLDLKGRPLQLEAAVDMDRLFCTLVGKGVAVIDISRAPVLRYAGLISMQKAPSAMRFKADRLFLAGFTGLQVLPLEKLKYLPSSPDSVYPFELSRGKIHLLPWRDRVFAYNLQDLTMLADAGTGLPPSANAHQKDAPLLALPDPSGLRLHPLRDGLPELQPSGRVPLPDTSLDPILMTDWHSGRLFVLTKSRLRIFDRTPAGTLTLAGEYQPPWSMTAMAWRDPGFIVVASDNDEEGRIEVVDVSVPATPRVVGSRVMPRHQRTVGNINDLLIDGERLFVSRSRLGVEIYDLSSPAVPKLMQRIDTPGVANKLSLGNGLLMVGDQDEGLFIIDVQDEFGLPVRSYRLPTIAREILFHNSRIFITNSGGGVLRFPEPCRIVPERGTSGNTMVLPIPAGVPPGRYVLALYDGEVNAEFPVLLQ